MNARTTIPAALAAALLVSVAALPSAASISPATDMALPAATLTLADPMPAAPEFALLHQPALPGIVEAGVHYRPRREGWGRRQDAASVSQVHLGFYDPDGDPSRKFLMGIRGGPMIDSRVQLGVGLDWAHQTDNTSSVSHQSVVNGQLITVKTQLSRASTNFFPIMGFVQLSADDDLPVIPYFGAGGGYELMNLSADDYQTGASFDATYGGWGWQIWGGAALPLSGRSRLMAELYVNNAELGRDVTDSTTGNTYRETVNANGLGMRFGLAWGF